MINGEITTTTGQTREHPTKKSYMGKTILIIEGSRPVRSMLSYMLMSESYSVLEARDGKDACKKLTEGVKANLIITGQDESGKDGLMFLKEIRGMPGCKFIPILMLAQKSMLNRQMEWKEAGATAWITKPFTSEQLLEMVDLVLF